jgi:hypothetical protein
MKNLLKGIKQAFVSEERYLTRLSFAVNYGSDKEGYHPIKVHFLLFERENGERIVEVQSESVPELAGKRITRKNWASIIQEHSKKQPVTFLFSTEKWVDNIYPWLCGRAMPNIPAFEDVPKHDFKRALKGS